jgi:hypothetical protein
MKRLLTITVLLFGFSTALHAQQDFCPSPPSSINNDRPIPPQPEIAPQPGGWTFRPGRGVDMTFGNVPFPDPPRSEGFLTIQYVHTHNNPGNSCYWKLVDLIRVTVLSFADSDGTIDQRTDVFELPFNTDQPQNYSLDLNDRWIKKIDLAAHNRFGWSFDSNSFYSGPQYTGRRANTQVADLAKEAWMLCKVPD